MSDDTTRAQALLGDLRKSIDNLDAILVHTLAERFRCTQEVGRLKATHDLPPADPAREARQIARLENLSAESGLDPEFAKKFMRFIVDEVITAFRFMYGGAQDLLQVKPDLTALGKIIGGGLPIGAYGGRRDLMRQIAPAGPVYQAGTLSGNPLAVAAGTATLRLLASRPEVYDRLEATSAALAAGLRGAASKHGVPLQVQRQGSMVGLFFTDRPVTRLEDVDASDRERFARVFHRLLEDGVHLPPSPYETLFVSAAHGAREIDDTVFAFERAIENQARAGGPST